MIKPLLFSLLLATMLGGFTQSYASPKDSANAKPTLAKLRQNAIKKKAKETLDADQQQALNELSLKLHEQDNAIYNELRDDEELSTANIGMLWEVAVERSGTIRYAIEKLSKKDATGEPVQADRFAKKIVNNLIHLGGVAGTMWTGSPAGLMGSNLVQNIVNDNSDDASRLSQVTDADMVILAKEVEQLQSQVIDAYYRYHHNKERLRIATEALQVISKHYDTLTIPAKQSAFAPLVNGVYNSLKNNKKQIEAEYESSRTSLSLLVGPEAIAVLDKDLT